SRRRHTRLQGDWSSDVCSSDLGAGMVLHFLRDRLSWDWRYALLAIIALVIFVRLGRFIMLFPLAGAYFSIWFARRYDPWLDYAQIGRASCRKDGGSRRRRRHAQ